MIGHCTNGRCNKSWQEWWVPPYPPCLPIKLGGLGLIDPAKIATPARLGSLLFSNNLLTKLGVDPNLAPFFLDSCLSEYKRNLGLPVDFPLGEDCGQRVLSHHAHLKAHTELLNDGDVRDQNRLRSLSLPHSTAFLHAPPNFYTGTGMTPREFRLAIKWVLGLPIVTEPFFLHDLFSPCPVTFLTFLVTTHFFVKWGETELRSQFPT